MYLSLKLKYYYLLVFLLSLFFIPTIFHSMFGASSFSAGLIFVSISFLLFVRRVYSLNCSVVVFLFLFLSHVTVSHLIFDLDERVFFSLIGFLLVFLSTYFVSNFLYHKVVLESEFIFYLVLFVFLLFGLLTYLTDFEFGRFFYKSHKPVFPFKEPSHYALAVAPCYIFLLTLNKFHIRFILFLAFFFLGVSLESFLLVVISSSAFFLFGVRGVLRWPLLVLGFLSIIFFVVGNEYYLKRLTISNESNNLTALVFLQGVQDAYNAFKDTFGFGLGFQMLGNQDPSSAHYQITEITGGYGLNRFDGGFLSAKIISEFGVLGIIFLLYYSVLVLKSVRYIFNFTRHDANGNDKISLFAAVCVFSLSYELFIRGVGYFSPGVFLFISSVFYLKKMRVF